MPFHRQNFVQRISRLYSQGVNCRFQSAARAVVQVGVSSEHNAVGHPRLTLRQAAIRRVLTHGEMVAVFFELIAFSEVGVASSEELTRENYRLFGCTLCSTVYLKDMNAANTATHAAFVLPLAIGP